jgi:hypothetical protein
VPAVRLLLLAAVTLVAATACGSSDVRTTPVARHATALEHPPPSVPPVPVVEAGDGRLEVVPGVSGVSGPGERTTYVVEVEGGLGVDAIRFAAEVERTLADPRSWGAAGRRGLQRVDDADDVDLRIALASPDTTDQLCAPLDTGGYFSCANGARAVVNVARWLRGAPSYQGQLEDYRAYVVNHEVGHTLGLGHADCPGAGEPAPVMLQQTKGLDGCTRSPWPYP